MKPALYMLCILLVLFASFSAKKDLECIKPGYL